METEYLLPDDNKAKNEQQMLLPLENFVLYSKKFFFRLNLKLEKVFFKKKHSLRFNFFQNCDIYLHVYD